MTLTLAGSFTTPQPSRPSQLRLYIASSPAPGADWLESVPPGQQWQPITIRANLVCSAAVASRQVYLSLSSSATYFLNVITPAAVAASGNVDFSFYAGAVDTSLANAQNAPVPRITLMSGATIGTSTINIQAADQWATVRIYTLVYL